MNAKDFLLDRLRALKKNSFYTKKAGSFSDVPPRTVQSWTEKGIVTPDIADTTGTGSKRLYSVRNCIEIGIIKSLTENRLSLTIAAKIIEYLKSLEKGGAAKPKIDDVLAARAGFLVVKIDSTDVVSYTIHLSQFISHQTFDISSRPRWNKVLILNIKQIAESVIKKMETT